MLLGLIYSLGERFCPSTAVLSLCILYHLCIYSHGLPSFHPLGVVQLQSLQNINVPTFSGGKLTLFPSIIPFALQPTMPIPAVSGHQGVP